MHSGHSSLIKNLITVEDDFNHKSNGLRQKRAYITDGIELECYGQASKIVIVAMNELPLPRSLNGVG